MRKSISVAFFSTVATLLILAVAVMGLSQLVLFSKYFAEERFDTLDDVGDLAGRTVGYFWDDLTESEKMESVVGQVDLIGESANVYIFFTDTEGKVVLASNSNHLTQENIPPEVLANVAGAEEGACNPTHNILSIIPIIPILPSIVNKCRNPLKKIQKSAFFTCQIKNVLSYCPKLQKGGTSQWFKTDIYSMYPPPVSRNS